MDSKQCSACKQILTLDNFSKSNRSANTYRGRLAGVRYGSLCKPCASAYAKQWRQANPDYERKRNAPKKTPEEVLKCSFVRARLHDAKQRATKYGKPIDVDFEYLYELLDFKCAISQLPINMVKGDLDVASLDCIIPKLGYIRGNVQWVSWRVNRAKGEQSQEDFISMCKAVFEGATTISKESTLK